MRVARVRLKEMLALGEVSHFSLAGLDVSWHVFSRRLPFSSVGENVANGHFVTLDPRDFNVHTGKLGCVT